jgi:hypothetical protein
MGFEDCVGLLDGVEFVVVHLNVVFVYLISSGCAPLCNRYWVLNQS